MEYNLFPEGYETEVIEEQDVMRDSPIGYKNGIAFDYEQMDFRRDGKHKLLDSDGVDICF